MSKATKLTVLVVGLASLAFAPLAFAPGTASAQGATECQAPEAVCQRVATYVTANIKPWSSDPTIVNAVTAQNAASAKLTSADIDKLDAAWSGKSDTGLVESKMNNDLATFLKRKKEAGSGIIRDILIFDSKGLNVAQTDMTQDYNQGDEAKYTKTYSVGPDAVFIDKITKEGSANVLQANLSIKDPQSGKAIGAMTVGVNVDDLK